MNAADIRSWAIVVAVGLLGVGAGRLWSWLLVSRARRRRANKLDALRAELQQLKATAGQLERELLAQRTRSFALERELQARESAWAQSSPTPFSFDERTFEMFPTVDPVLYAEPARAEADGAHGSTPAPLEIEGLRQRIDTIQNSPLPAPVDALPDRVDACVPARSDDLTLIRGIDAELQSVLNATGYRTYHDIARASRAELGWALALAGSRFVHVQTQDWHQQATQLADRRTMEAPPPRDTNSAGRLAPC